jgi:DNA gyrase/topoisomerase IV, subunit A
MVFFCCVSQLDACAAVCGSAALTALCICMHSAQWQYQLQQVAATALRHASLTLSHNHDVHTSCTACTHTLLCDTNNSPRDVLENLRRRIRQEPMVEMQPWFRGFVGTIKKKAGTTAAAKAGYTTEGIVERTGHETVEITELPIKRWTQDYKVMLEVLSLLLPLLLQASLLLSLLLVLGL